MLLLIGDVISVQLDVSAVHVKTPGDGVEQGGFAGAVAADDGGKITVVEPEREPGEGFLFIHSSFVENLGDRNDIEHQFFPPFGVFSLFPFFI